MTRDYVLDQGFADELLDELGIGPEWKCLEVGAGGGSMVDWMASRGTSAVRIRPGFDFFRLTFESLRGSIAEAGLLTAEEADAGSAGFNESVRLLTPLMMAGIGRRG